jgi:DNA-binding response OmpR family regulator
MKILVVEDDTLIREGLSEMLLREGYIIDQAKDGVEGLQKYNEFQPDLVCLDVMMPKMSGYDLCREIRKTNAQGVQDNFFPKMAHAAFLWSQ